MNAELETRDAQYARSALVFLAHANTVLNLFDFSAASAGDVEVAVDSELAARVEQLIIDRRAARDRKDFAAADRIRDELKAMGVVLKDGPTGVTTWEKL